MYAIVKSGGHQYHVTEGQVVRVNLLEGEPGSEVVLGEVLLVANGEMTRCGQPLLEGAQVKAEVISHARDKKILVFKKKRRQGYHKAQGHRQYFTALKILSIEA
ncbi:MAG: 50S ribosomal protein L21 [Deltaproteobacteria bacterium]|jgi:large subunit ribosomal protein L21|nr:50S ribosomal protein L21 [Deltaproteobacteria bacterium]